MSACLSLLHTLSLCFVLEKKTVCLYHIPQNFFCDTFQLRIGELAALQLYKLIKLVTVRDVAPFQKKKVKEKKKRRRKKCEGGPFYNKIC